MICRTSGLSIPSPCNRCPTTGDWSRMNAACASPRRVAHGSIVTHGIDFAQEQKLQHLVGSFTVGTYIIVAPAGISTGEQRQRSVSFDPSSVPSSLDWAARDLGELIASCRRYLHVHHKLPSVPCAERSQGAWTRSGRSACMLDGSHDPILRHSAPHLLLRGQHDVRHDAVARAAGRKI